MTAATATNERRGGMPWWLVLIDGILAIIVGILLLVYPIRTFIGLSVFIGLYWFISGIFDIVSIFGNRAQWGWKLFMGIIGIIAGGYLMTSAISGALTLAITTVWIVGLMGIFYGFIGLIRAFQGAGWGAGILGVVSIVLGFYILSNRIATMLALPWVFGWLAIIGGFFAIFGAFALRRAAKAAKATPTPPAMARTAAPAPVSGAAVAGATATGAVVAATKQEPTPEGSTTVRYEGVSYAHVTDSGTVETMSESVTAVETAAGDVAIKTEETSAVVDSASGEVLAAADHTQTYAESAAGDVAAATEERSGFIAAATAAGAVAAFAHEESATVATPEGIVAASAAETIIATETSEGVAIEASEQTAAMVVTEEGAVGELTSETVDLAATGAGVVAVHSASVIDFTETPEGEIAAVEAGAVEVLAAGEAAKALEAGEVAEPVAVEIPNAVEIAEDQARFLKYEIEYVEGIGPAFGAKLKALGINTPLDLLSKGATRKGRELIAEASGITLTLILKWVNHCDLFRLKGVGSEFADLLEAAGVDTVVELAQRNPANLHAKLSEVNEEKKLVRQTPAASQVEDWVAQAKELPRIVTY